MTKLIYDTIPEICSSKERINTNQTDSQKFKN